MGKQEQDLVELLINPVWIRSYMLGANHLDIYTAIICNLFEADNTR
jgi:hypothetical protein